MLGLTCRIDSSEAVQDGFYDQVGSGFFLPSRPIYNAGSIDGHDIDTAITTVL